MSDKKQNQSEKKELSLQERIEAAWTRTDNKDLFAVPVKRGDNIPLLSGWEVGSHNYVVVAVGLGWAELQRI